jgi:hypothetical protein
MLPQQCRAAAAWAEWIIDRKIKRIQGCGDATLFMICRAMLEGGVETIGVTLTPIVSAARHVENFLADYANRGIRDFVIATRNRLPTMRPSSDASALHARIGG